MLAGDSVANGLHWRSSGNSLLVSPGADDTIKPKVENYQLSLNENGPAPNQTCNIADAEVPTSSPVFCQCIVVGSV